MCVSRKFFCAGPVHSGFAIGARLRLELADLDHLRVETTDLNEIDVARIQIGDTASITFDALPDTVVTVSSAPGGVLVGSGGETAEETALYLQKQGEKVGVLTVRLYRPFSVSHFVQASPDTE